MKMKVFWQLLFCTLIILISGSTAEKFSSYQDISTQYVDSLQEDDSINYRLPTSIKPISYELMLMPKLEYQNFTFQGIVKITATVESVTKEITLHVGDIKIIEESVLINKQSITVFSRKYDNITEKYTITVPALLQKGTEILIAFTYNGTLRNDMIGFYRSSYFDKNKQLKWLAATQFQTTHARHAFPCFDEPSFKARFTIRILRNKNQTCLSNMPLLNTEELEGGKIWDIFKESIPMSTYLVAFIISDFQSLNENIFKVWAKPSAIDQANYALLIGTTALKLLANKFNQEYQLPKIDMVAVPDFSAGAMENWGLITYRESGMLYDENESSAPAQQRVASVIVHELTHMWFGNLVTPEWWSYLWLSEGFARYFQYFATAELEESWNMKEQFVVEQHQSALIVDGLESSLPMTRTVSTRSQIRGIGDSITYSKGASIIRMMSHVFEVNNFHLALQDYLQNNKAKGLAHPDTLWSAIAKRATFTYPQSVKTIMDTWTMQAGYPIVSITISNKDARVTQQRLFLRNLDGTPTNVTWWVPLTWTTQSKPNFNSTTPKTWLFTDKPTIPLNIDSKEWVIFNVQSMGFYRVKYNRDGWQRIFNALNSDTFNDIHVLNRAGIVDDLLNLGRANYEDYKTVLEGILYLQRETNYLPFKAAFNGLDYLNKRFTGYKEHSLFKKYVLSLINNRRKELGYEDRKNDDRLTILLRREINNWACNLDDKECITVYINKFKKWKANTSLPIKPNERTTTYCVAMRYGTVEDWEFLWKQYFNSNHAADQTVIISALGCTLNTTILERYLGYAITEYKVNRIRRQDSTSVFASVYNSGLIGAEYVLQFVEKYHKNMEKYYGGQGTIATILNGASQHFSTIDLVNKFENFTNNYKKEFAPILNSLESSLKIAKYELNWYKSASIPIIQWLQTYEYRLPTNISPKNYLIFVKPYLDTGKFDGNVKIEANVVQKTKQIVLHSADIEHKTISVTTNQKKINVIKQTLISKYDFFVIDLDQELAAETNLTIEISYAGHLNPSELRGFYRSSYTNKYGQNRWLAATHLEPVGARKMFPCFDEPAMKAFFTVRVSASPDYHVVSNMKWTKIEKNDDRNVFTFNESVKMSTYLLAVIISDFYFDFNKMNKPQLGVLSRPNAINQSEYALDLMAPFVSWFENKLKLEYQISKLYMAALPDFPSGAGENWGLITYRESNMLYDVKHSSLTSKERIRNVIAHEISHQWFGNLVSPLWWKYLWLNEGFARYFEYHAPANVFNDTAVEGHFVVDQVQSALKADSSKSTHAMTHDVYSPSQIRSMFDTITYNKGASVLRMVEKTYGSTVFYAALSDYLNKRKYDVATSEDLYAALQAKIKEDDIKAFLDTWTTQPGYPVVHVNVAKNITLKQERFFLKEADRGSSNAIWHIPITWAFAHKDSDYFNTTPKVWLREKEAEIPLDSTNLILNVQQSGYYRVNYDKTHWETLINYLNNEDIDTIHEINRAMLIDDLMNLARADYVHYKTVLSAIDYLIRRENSYLPWRAFYNNLPYLYTRFQGRNMENIFKKYLTSIIMRIYNRLQFEDYKTESYEQIKLRMYTREWACKLDILDCKYHVAKYYQNRFKEDIPPNYRGVVYCTTMRSDATENTYKFLWRMYLNSNVVADKIVILNSIACSQNKNILKLLLLKAVTKDSDIRYQDSAQVFSNVYDASLIGVEVVMDFIKTNYDDILQQNFGDYTKIAGIVSSLASKLSTRDLYNQYQNLLKWLIIKEPAFRNLLYSYSATAEYEFNWYEKYGPLIFEQLDKRFLDDNKYRLPQDFNPELYHVTLTPDIQKGTFEGTVKIYMEVKEHVSSIVLNAHNLQIEGNITVYKVYKDWKADKTIQVLNYTQDVPQQLRIYLYEFVNTKKIIVEITKFKGILNDNMEGFYRSSYLDKNGVRQWLATTQFQPTHARQAFPCFDEPAFRSKFIINITTPKNYKALSNMPASNTTTNESYSFEVSNVKMPTYLVAFVISKFEPVEKPEVFLNVWGRPNIIQHGEFAQDVAVNILNEMKEFTNISYLFPKLDLVGIPDFSMGAMENWGLATFREYGLFYNKNETTATYEKYIITVIAHELAHMWFGNLVTCEWWDYIWLNEGFAQYFQWFLADLIRPDYQFMDQFVVYELQSALSKDASSLAHPMTNVVETPEQINNIFNYVAYGKSASILRMIFNVFGQEVSKSALRAYLKDRMSIGIANPTNLWKSFESQVKSIIIDKRNVTIQEVIKTWTNQPGYPVVRTRLLNKYIELSQERFIIGDNQESHEFYWIPINIMTFNYYNNNTYSIWLGPESKYIFIDLTKEWYILNHNLMGFYRVDYDTESLKRLIKELNSEHFETIPILNRAQILDDLFNVLRTDKIESFIPNRYSLLLEATKYLKRETNHLPWKAFFNGLSYVYERYEGSYYQKFLDEYILSLISEMYKKVGFSDRDDDKHLDELNREMFLQWACKLNQTECVETSKSLFTAWNNNKLTRIPRNARAAVYCTVIREGTMNEWNILWNQYLEANFASEQKIIINALGCSTNRTLLEKYLWKAFEKGINPPIRKQDISAVFASVYSASQTGVDVTLDFLIANLNMVHDHFGNWNDVIILFNNVASHITDGGLYLKLHEFVYSNDHSKVRQKFRHALDIAEENLKWCVRNCRTINIWLNSNTTITKGNSSARIESLNVVFVILIALISFFFY